MYEYHNAVGEACPPRFRSRLWKGVPLPPPCSCGLTAGSLCTAVHLSTTGTGGSGWWQVGVYFLFSYFRRMHPIQQPPVNLPKTPFNRSTSVPHTLHAPRPVDQRCGHSPEMPPKISIGGAGRRGARSRKSPTAGSGDARQDARNGKRPRQASFGGRRAVDTVCLSVGLKGYSSHHRCLAPCGSMPSRTVTLSRSAIAFLVKPTALVDWVSLGV